MSNRHENQGGFSGILVESIEVPVTASLCIVAIGLSLIGWSHVGLDPFVLDSRAFWTEPWRALSSHFVHGGAFHLLFNVMWTWTFGRLLERVLGSSRFLLLNVCLALGVAWGCHAFDRGGIGLSGIGYGLWAFLFVRDLRARPGRPVLDKRTNQLFVVWFFVCILLTKMDVWHISNWGHGLGAVLGAAFALVAEIGRTRRVAAATITIGILGALLLFATVLRGYVNASGVAWDHARLAYTAQEAEDWATARAEFTRALEFDDEQPDWWWNLACAQYRLGDHANAADSAFLAWQLGPMDAAKSESTRDMLLHISTGEITTGRYDLALTHAQCAALVAPDFEPAWEKVALAGRRAGDEAEVERAQAELKRLREGR